MVFNTLVFIIFAAIFFPTWMLVRRFAPKVVVWGYLVAASCVFYGWWNWKFLFLLFGSGLLDYTISLAIVKYPQWKGRLLACSIAGNIGSLFFFKYLGLATETVNWLLPLLGLEANYTPWSLTLPVGISFYTFQSMSYTIDVARGRLKPSKNILQFFAYLSLFPQLVAGPIVRASQLLPQLGDLPASTPEQRWMGLRQITFGLVKKCIVADTLGQIVNFQYGFADPVASTAIWWGVGVLFMIQIYCDFSGYSDIAIGLGKWMGLDFPKNFNHPYTSSSFQEFWNRWHISLSSWFRDYLYIPLARRWNTPLGLYAAIFVTFTVSGLWHGAAWNFVIWGALHGLLLAFEQATRWDVRVKKLPFGRAIAMFVVFAVICVTFVIFRAQSTEQLFAILKIMFSFQQVEYSWWGSHWPVFMFPHIFAIAPLFILWELYQGTAISRRHKGIRWEIFVKPTPVAIVCLAFILLACIFLRGPNAAFIYFQF